MKDLLALSVRELATRVGSGELKAEAVARAYAERSVAADPTLHAWQYFNADEAVARAKQWDDSGKTGDLAGVPVGVKDVMDTEDMPSTYGSPIYASHRPTVDAAAVAAVRTAGGIPFGKTVTTEFATFKPGPTVNPRGEALGRTHTPGGSSSGSAAAVAAGMVPVAFGTQTAASIVRPAAFCGVVGYKPTFGTLPTAGAKPLAPSLDTIGVLARSVDDAAYFVGTLARRELLTPAWATTTGGKGLRVGVFQGPHWALADGDAREALQLAGVVLESAGATLADADLGAVGDLLTSAQIAIMGYEAAGVYAPELRTHAALLSPAFRAVLEAGAALDGDEFARMQKIAQVGRIALEKLFEQFDVLITPSAAGEAPEGIASTGDPSFSRMWTLLGCPCVQVPVGVGRTGMPVGVTVVAPRWADPVALATAARIEQAVSK